MSGQQVQPVSAESNGDTRQRLVPKQGRIATLEAEVGQLRTDMDEVRWCFAELMFKMKLSAAQQLRQNPQVQEKLQQMLVAQIGQSLPQDCAQD